MKRAIQYDEQCHVRTQLANIQSYPIHYHEDVQIIYVLEGELSLKLFYSNYRLESGSIHFIHSEDVHSLESITEDNLAIVLYLDRDYFNKIFPHFAKTVFITNLESTSQIDAIKLLKEQIFAVIAEDIEHAPGYAGRMDNAAVSMINTLIKNFRGFSIDTSAKAYIHQTAHDYMQVDRISRIIRYIYENYQYKISLSEIAEQEQISPYYLSHVFQKLVGMNFRDFLSLVRVEMSEAMILSTDKSISQIAQAVGFSDAKYYIRHFYDYLGSHPKEFRRLHMNQTYGKVKPDVEEYDLSYLVPIIDNYTQSPVFKKISTPAPFIAVDFQAKPINVLKKPDTTLSSIRYILNDVSRNIVPNDKLIKYYLDVVPNESIIKLFSQMTEDPSNFTLQTIDVFDSDANLSGILTSNGLRKPLFYFLEILESLPTDVISYGLEHIALKDKALMVVIAFNPDKHESKTIDLTARNIVGHCKLTKYYLRAAKTGITYWSQLNFSEELSRREINEINLMSHPDISFELIPPDSQIYKSIELEPYDVAVLRFDMWQS